MSGNHHVHAHYDLASGASLLLARDAHIQKMRDFSMFKEQRPIRSVACCADSRQNANIAAGTVEFAGETLKFATTGGYLIGPDGKLLNEAGRWLELTHHYGIDLAVSVGHTLCGQGNIIYTYHKVPGGAEAVAKIGRYFAAHAKSLAPIVDRVDELGMNYFYRMKVPFKEEAAADLQQAMALFLLVEGHRAVDDGRKSGDNFPKLGLQFHDLDQKRFYELEDPKTPRFREVKPNPHVVLPDCMHV